MAQIPAESVSIEDLLARPGLSGIAARLTLAVDRHYRREGLKRGVSPDTLRDTYDAVVTYDCAGHVDIELAPRDSSGRPRVRVHLA